MTDTWSQEQIEAAFKGLVHPALIKDGIVELTKPKWTPQEGEIVFNKETGFYYRFGKHRTYKDCLRSITPDEVPALKVAIEFIENNRTHNGNRTLEIIKKLT